MATVAFFAVLFFLGEAAAVVVGLVPGEAAFLEATEVEVVGFLVGVAATGGILVLVPFLFCV